MRAGEAVITCISLARQRRLKEVKNGDWRPAIWNVAREYLRYKEPRERRRAVLLCFKRAQHIAEKKTAGGSAKADALMDVMSRMPADLIRFWAEAACCLQPDWTPNPAAHNL